MLATPAPDMLLTLLSFGVVISANNLAIALTLGSLGQRSRQSRILLSFGVFEFFVPLLGVWLGRQMAMKFADYTVWLGPALLIGLGIATIFNAFRESRDSKKLARAVTTWKGLLVLSAGLSVDNLIVGFSLGLGQISPLALATTIMVCSMIFTWAGLQLGHKVQKNYETPMSVFTGSLLILLAMASLMGWL